jgi:hypothetical protein
LDAQDAAKAFHEFKDVAEIAEDDAEIAEIKRAVFRALARLRA